MKKSSKSSMDTLDKCIAGICNGDHYARQQFNFIVYSRCCPEVNSIKVLADQVKFGEKLQKHALKQLTSAADSGNLNALAVLAHMLSTARGIKNSAKNYQKGLEYLNKPELKDNVFANYYLGSRYKYGLREYSQFQIDYPKAIECFNKAIALGCSDSIYELGHMYETGNGFERNQAIADKYYLEAAEKGSVLGLYVARLKGNKPNLTPYAVYKPKNFDMICEIGFDKLAKVEGNAYYIETTHVSKTLFVSITYSGNLPIDKNLIEQKLTSLNGFPIDRKEWDVQMWSYFRGGVKFSVGDKSEDRQMLYDYQFMLLLADLIHKADDLLADRISTYQKQHSGASLIVTHGQVANSNNVSGMPGFFSASQQDQARVSSTAVSNVNTPVAPPLQILDPGTTLEIMQMLQSNPQFASQVGQLLQQYKAYHASQMK